MLNKDKRSLCLMMVLGDGCLHYVGSAKRYAALTIDHGIAQSDYQSWKAQLLSNIFERDVKVRQGHKGKSIQVSVCNNTFRAWRKFTYPNGKKDLAKILPFIRHPEMAMAVWLMDDGYVEPSISKLADGSKKNYGARFRIFTCDQTQETQDSIIKWLGDNFNIKAKVHLQKKGDKQYPFLKINQEDSLLVWEKIRTFVLGFKSMRHKFRHMEELYQYRMAQRVPNILLVG